MTQKSRLTVGVLCCVVYVGVALGIVWLAIGTSDKSWIRENAALWIILGFAGLGASLLFPLWMLVSSWREYSKGKKEAINGIYLGIISIVTLFPFVALAYEIILQRKRTVPSDKVIG